MASTASTWYTDLDFDSYVLDIILLCFVGGAAAVYVSVNNIKKALGPVTRQPLVDRFRETVPTSNEQETAATRPKHGESCLWFNTMVSWLYLHYYNSPFYLDEWVKALNQQLDKLGGPVQNKVEKIQQSSLPPRVLNVACQTPPDGSIILQTKLECQDLLLSVFASQQTSEGVRLTNCAAHVLKLNGTLRLKIYTERKDVKVRTNFETRPEVKVEVNPTNPYQDPSTLVDLGVVERNVRNALALAATTITITKLLMPGDLSSIPGRCPEEETLPPRPGEIRVRASDAGWGMSSRDIAMLNQRFTAQRLQNQIDKLAAFTAANLPTIPQEPPQTRVSNTEQPAPAPSKDPAGIEKVSVQPLRQLPPQTSSKPVPQKPDDKASFDPMESSQPQTVTVVSSSPEEDECSSPPQGGYAQDDLELVRPQGQDAPDEKKSRSLRGSLKKLFKRGQRSRSRGKDKETSKENPPSEGNSRTKTESQNPKDRDLSAS